MLPEIDSVAAQRRALLELVELDKSDLERSIPKILAADARALGIERVSFWRFSEDRSRIRCEQLYQLSDGKLSSGVDLQAADFPAYFAALNDNRVINAPDARADPRTREFNERYFKDHGIRSLLDVPVWHRGQLEGVLCHENVGETPRLWTEFDVDFALSMGGMLALALEGHARRQAESRYQMLTGALQDLVWDWNLLTDHISWNDTVFGGLKFKLPEVKPSFQWWKDHVHPDDLQRVTDGLARHAATGRGLWRDEYRFRRGDGSWAMIIDRGILERAPDGKAVRMVGAMQDVSEQRELEARLLLSDRMASVGTLAAGVAHEINNPLSYVATNLRFAQRVLELQPAMSKVTAALNDAQSGVERVQAIVRDLKTFSRPEDLENAAVDMRAAIESAVAMAKNEILHRARLRLEIEGCPAVFGNAARLGQVLLNLLVNAAQAIPDGRAQQNEILVRSSSLSEGRVRIEVRDTGRGVPKELLPRIFDPFFTTKPVGEGTGLGLAICHSIVTSMGGTLTVENNQDRGATARIDLNRAAAPSTPAKGTLAEPAAGGPRRRGRVLIIDDVENVGISLQRLFSDSHQVELMTRSRVALEAIARGESWDVILCDLMMPELNGMEFVAEVTKLNPGLLPRIIIMTGGAFSQTAREFLAKWPHRRLDKPFDVERLIAEVDRSVAQQ